jgi:hypothetical protein
MRLEAVRRWLTTISLAGLAVAALLAVLRPPQAGAGELPIGDAGGLSSSLDACAAMDAPLGRLDCFDQIAAGIDPGAGWLQGDLSACSKRSAPLDRLDCYVRVTHGMGVTPEPQGSDAAESLWPDVEAGPAPAQTRADVECFTLPPLASFDVTVPMTIRDHLDAGRTNGAVVFGNGNPTYPYVICAW